MNEPPRYVHPDAPIHIASTWGACLLLALATTIAPLLAVKLRQGLAMLSATHRGRTPVPCVATGPCTSWRVAPAAPERSGAGGGMLMVEHTRTVKTGRRRLTLVLAALVLLGLGAEFVVEGPPWAGGRRVLWYGSSVPGHISAHFHYFDGKDARRLAGNAGEAFTIRYDLEPDKGVLTLTLLSPEGTAIWTRSTTEPALGSATVPLPESGPYRVQITGDKSRGSFAVDYRVAAPVGP